MDDFINTRKFEIRKKLFTASLWEEPEWEPCREFSLGLGHLSYVEDGINDGWKFMYTFSLHKYKFYLEFWPVEVDYE
jgi:hypothetical protein